MADESCSNCGEKLQPGVQFCGSCGAKTGAVAQEAQTAKTEASGPAQEQVGQPKAAGTPPTKEEKNKLIAFMLLSIFIPIIGIVFGIIFYNKKDQKSGMFYLMCGLAGILWGIIGGTVYWFGLGWILGAVVVAAVIYNGMKQINSGVISADL